MAENKAPLVRVSSTPYVAPGTPPVPRRAPTLTAPPRRRSWLGTHKLLVALVALGVLGATIGMAALLIRQDVTTNPSATNAVIKFQNGNDYTSINAAGFATLTIPSSASSATMALTGVSGAALTTLGDVLAINNTASATNYTVTIARSTTLNAAITSCTVTIKDGSSAVVVWDPLSNATSGSYTHVAGRVLNVTVALVVADGTAAGSLGSFGMQFSFTPV